MTEWLITMRKDQPLATLVGFDGTSTYEVQTTLFVIFMEHKVSEKRGSIDIKMMDLVFTD